MTHPTPNQVYTVANGTASTAPFIEVFQPRRPTVNDVNYQIQQRWWDTDTDAEFILVGFTYVSGQLQAIWKQIASATAPVETLTGNSGGAVPPDSANNINVVGDGSIITATGTPLTNTLTVAITGVVPVGRGGTGDSTFTPYVPICGGTTDTGPLQQASTGFSTSGYVLTSTGSSSLPTFQAVSASGAVIQLDGDTGSATPSAGVITISGGSTGLTTAASGSTVDLTGTLGVSHGGTGDTSFTEYAPICGGTSATGPLQQASTGLGTSGYVLTSNGSSALPSFKPSPSPSGPSTVFAWVLFTSSGVGSLTVINSYNVASFVALSPFTHIGQLTFTTNASNANYGLVSAGSDVSTMRAVSGFQWDYTGAESVYQTILILNN